MLLGIKNDSETSAIISTLTVPLPVQDYPIYMNVSQNEFDQLLYNPYQGGVKESNTGKFKRRDVKLVPRMNVLVWMFDGVSRNFFIRNVPKTWEYMTKVMKGTVFENYNVVGRNSLPNIVPFWTGNIYSVNISG